LYSYCINKALVAFHGRPLFLFSANGISFADEDGLQNFNLIAIPITCLQINSLKKLGQLQSPFFHCDALSDKVTFDNTDILLHHIACHEILLDYIDNEF